MMRRLLIPFTLIFLFVLALDIYPGLRGGSGWRWDYERPENLLPVLILAALLVIYVAGVWWTHHKPTWMGLTWAVVMSAVLAVSVVSVRGNPAELLFIRTVSPVQTGASTIAVTYMAEDGLEESLDNWTGIMRESLDLNLIHFTTSPPGQPLIHYAAANLLESAPPLWSYNLRPYQCSNVDVMTYTRGEILSVGFVGLLMPLWAALGVLPVFVASRNIYKDKNIALRTSQWWALIPTILLFMPVWNVLYPALSALSFALLLAGITQQRGWLAMLGGVVMSVTTFLNFAVLPVLLFFGLFTLGYYRSNLSQAIKIGIWFGVGLLACWIPFWLVTGYTPIDIFAVTLEKHTGLVQRDYLPWVILHPYDTLLFMGIPLAGTAMWAVISASRDMLLHVRATYTDRSTTRTDMARHVPTLIAVTLGITFILIDLSGIAQGENGRIMSFYAPFLLFAAARWLDDLALMSTQALTVLVMASVLAVVPLDLNLPPDAPRTDQQTLDSIEISSINAQFISADYRGTFTLTGYRLIADVGAQSITLETIWAGDERTERPYELEVIARVTGWENEIDSQTMTDPIRWIPQNGNYPPTCWQSGDVIHDMQIIPLPVVAAPVTWTLELRAIDARSGDVAWIITSEGERTQTLIIAEAQYP